jgi:hypothetical protein
VGVEAKNESKDRGGARLQRKPPALEGSARFLISFAAAVAAVVVFAWASQARQDEAIRRNDTAIAVIHTKLDFVCEKLDEIRKMLAEREDNRKAP